METSKIITSVNNPLVVRMSKLKDTKFRRAEGLFLCEGSKLVSEALALSNVEYLFIEESGFETFSDLLSRFELSNVKLFILSEAAFSKISTEKSPQGIIAAVSSRVYCDLRSVLDSESIFLVDGVRDPGNLGTIIRTAGALGIEALVLSDCADVTNPKAIRASMGGVFRTKICPVGDMISVIRTLRESGRRVFAAALSGDSRILGEFDLMPTDVFMVGNEGHGLSSECISSATDSVIIKMKNDTESFNVSVASSIIMWELSKTF